MDRGAAEGGARWGIGVGRWVEGAADVWRERRSERRARAAARVGEAPRLRRSALAAAFDARLAVRAGVTLDDFLRHRLARYAGKLPVTLDALPAAVDVEAGEVVVRARQRPRAHGPRPEHEAGPGTSPLGGWSARDLREAEAALDALAARAGDARARADAVERDLAAALASGAIVARPAVEASAEQLGRPPVPSALPIHALHALVGLLLAAEGWRFTGPALAGAGVAGDGAVEAALQAAPLATTLALLFALGAASAAFAFAWLALARGADAVAAGAEASRRPLLLAAAAAAAALVPAVAAAASAPDRWAQLGLLAAVPFGAAALVRAAASFGVRREAAAVLALAWDRERAREAVERGRREEVWLRATEELRSAEEERAEARRHLARLHRDALAADRAAQLAARAEAERLERQCESLACALELDRYLYVRFAAERAGAELDRPRARVVQAGVATERLGVAG